MEGGDGGGPSWDFPLCPGEKRQKVGLQENVLRLIHGGGMRELAGLSPRSGAGLLLLLLILPVLLTVQLLVLARLWVEERDGAVALTVISIEPDRSSTGQAWRAQFRGPGLEEEKEMQDGDPRRDVARGFEDENEMEEVGLEYRYNCQVFKTNLCVFIHKKVLINIILIVKTKQ